MDKLVQGTAADGTIRVLAAITTDAVREAVRRHAPAPTTAAAFGRVLTGAALLGASLKEFDRLTVRIEGDGPAGSIIAEASDDGAVRGYIRNPQADLPARADGKFDVAGVIGKGMFHVIREAGFELGLHKDPYVGSVPITSGEIAEDFAYYLAKSEQIPSAVMLGVLLQNSEPYVSASGGVLLQMMPGVNEHIITMLEDTIAHAPHITTVISEGAEPADLLSLALGVIDFEILGEKGIRFECPCSVEKAKTMVAALGSAEIELMLNEDKGAVMDCGFCNESYRLTSEDLEEILDEARS